MIFVDSNIPIDPVGVAHPHKTDVQRLLERETVAGESLIRGVDAFQEILHRYVAIDRRDVIAAAWEQRASICDQIVG